MFLRLGLSTDPEARRRFRRWSSSCARCRSRWAPALSAKHVPVVDVGAGTEADFKKAGDISGKLVLVHSNVLKTWADLFNEYMKAPPVIEAAVEGKAKAIAFMATREHDMLYRHTNAMTGEIDRIPMVLVAREDGERVGRLLASGHPVWVDLSIPNKIGGPVKASNVIAEIKGSEKPDGVRGAGRAPGFVGTGHRCARQRLQRRPGGGCAADDQGVGTEAAAFDPVHSFSRERAGHDGIAGVRDRTPQRARIRPRAWRSSMRASAASRDLL